MSTQLYGLVLAGGFSRRMGIDKGSIDYHGKPQREFAYDLLSQFCDEVYYSIRKTQEIEMQGLPHILDEDLLPGPLNGILSAHSSNRKVAWLVLACDLPFLDKSSMQKLVESRDSRATATAYATSKENLPEPLVCIWEPAGLNRANSFIKTENNYSARDFLVHSNAKLVHPKNDQVLFNVNSRSDYEAAKEFLQKNRK